MTSTENQLQKNKNQPFPPKFGRRIAIVTASSNGRYENGFGTLETCKTFCDTVRKSFANVSYHQVLDISSLEHIVKERPDLVILCCKYILDPTTSEKIWLSDYFQFKNLIFTGSARKALTIASNKSIAKTIVKRADIATARHFLASTDQYRTEDELPLKLPLFIKPLDFANGSGIDEYSIARDFRTYSEKILELSSKHGRKVLVEEFLPGREFTVAIFNDETTGRRWTLPMEIISFKNKNGDRILGAYEKGRNLEQTRPVEEPLLSQLKTLASEVFSAVGARDFGRVDFKLDGSGIPNFLEINLLPGMTPESSYFPKACSFKEKGGSVNGSYSGMSYSQVANKIVEIGLNRFESRNRK